VDVVIGTSSFLREHSHGKDMTYIKNTAIKVINFVKSKGIEIRFSSKDSFRSDLIEAEVKGGGGRGRGRHRTDDEEDQSTGLQHKRGCQGSLLEAFVFTPVDMISSGHLQRYKGFWRTACPHVVGCASSAMQNACS